MNGRSVKRTAFPRILIKENSCIFGYVAIKLLCVFTFVCFCVSVCLLCEIFLVPVTV